MMGGGMAYRLGRVGALTVGTGSFLSVGIGLGVEVTTFEIAHRSLTNLTEESSVNPNLWRWSGQGGIRQGLLSSLITFGSLKGAGHLAQGENIFVQHLLQDTGMVFGHQISAAFGITPRPKDSLAEQFLHAEATNLQLGAGMALAHHVAPGIQGIERGLDLALREGENTHLPLFPFLQPAFATAGSKERPSVESPREANPRDHIFMAVKNDGEGPEPPPHQGLRLVEKGAIPSQEIPEDVTPTVPLSVRNILDRLFDRRQYTGQLLNFSLDSLLRQIQEYDFSPADQQNVRSWLEEIKQVQQLQNTELLELRSELWRLQAEGLLEQAVGDKALEQTQSYYTRYFRVREQLNRSQDTLTGPLNAYHAATLRRRLDWVINLPEFQRDFDWRATLASDLVSPSFLATDAYKRGLELLIHFHPQITQQDLDIYERAASGLIAGWEIAFDLDKTLGPVFDWHIAQQEVRNHPEKYDGFDFNYFVHQSRRMRLPYRGIHAMLLGLAAAGNNLRLYTVASNKPDNLDVFFNDFPLMKVAFGLAPHEDPLRLVNTDHIHRSPHVMEGIKRKEFYERYFRSPEGEAFVREVCKEAGVSPSYIQKTLEDGKIPLPGFPFDILVDDSPYFVGEMETLGFGRRWVEATGSAEAILNGLEEYFSKPLPSTTPRLQAWLQPRINPLTPSPAPSNLKLVGGREKGVITMEEAQLISISRKLRPHQDYLMGLEIDKGLLSRALSPEGSLHEKATVILNALLHEFYRDGLYKFPDRHPHCSKLLEIIRSSDPLKKEIQGILNTVDQDHGYNFLKVPLSTYFILG
jgi:hypothetical protein